MKILSSVQNDRTLMMILKITTFIAKNEWENITDFPAG